MNKIEKISLAMGLVASLGGVIAFICIASGLNVKHPFYVTTCCISGILFACTSMLLYTGAQIVKRNK